MNPFDLRMADIQKEEDVEEEQANHWPSGFEWIDGSPPLLRELKGGSCELPLLQSASKLHRRSTRSRVEFLPANQVCGQRKAL